MHCHWLVAWLAFLWFWKDCDCQTPSSVRCWRILTSCMLMVQGCVFLSTQSFLNVQSDEVALRSIFVFWTRIWRVRFWLCCSLVEIHCIDCHLYLLGVSGFTVSERTRELVHRWRFTLLFLRWTRTIFYKLETLPFYSRYVVEACR